jgi:hypothetical protein
VDGEGTPRYLQDRVPVRSIGFEPRKLNSNHNIQFTRSDTHHMLPRGKPLQGNKAAQILVAVRVAWRTAGKISVVVTRSALSFSTDLYTLSLRIPDVSH